MLQLFLALDCIQQYIPTQKPLNNSPESTYNLFKEILMHSRDTPYNPKKIVENLQKLDKSIGDGCQGDTKDLYLYIIKELENDMVGANNNNHPEGFYAFQEPEEFKTFESEMLAAARKIAKKDRGELSLAFAPFFKEKEQCKYCKQIALEYTLDLPLLIPMEPQEEALKEALKKKFEAKRGSVFSNTLDHYKESTDERIKNICEKHRNECEKKLPNYSQRKYYIDYGQVLFIAKTKKSTTHTDYPLTLSLKGIPYHLKGIAIHDGDTRHSGHYHGYVRYQDLNAKVTWWHVNDAKVSVVKDEREILKRKDAVGWIYERAPQ